MLRRAALTAAIGCIWLGPHQPTAAAVDLTTRRNDGSLIHWTLDRQHAALRQQRSSSSPPLQPDVLGITNAQPNYAFFSAHFASAAPCSFLGSLRCSSQRKRKRGPFERFLQPG